MSVPAIVDGHLHLWDPAHLRYPWLRGNALLERPYLAADFAAACAGLAVERAVFVQCDCDPAQARDEVAWVVAQAALDPRIGGIVAHAALERGAAAREELVLLAAEPMVRGVRRMLQGEGEPGFCVRADFVTGVRLLAGFDLSFDLCIRPEQLPDACALVRAVPEVRFVLDHFGKPAIAKRQFDPWRQQLAELAALPNAWCKLSGLIDRNDGQASTVEELQPWVDHVLASLGPGRLLFGSDWPVVLRSADYRRWVETADRLLAGLSAIDRGKVFRDNAIGFYHLH